MSDVDRQLDLICMGRAAVDLYAQQIGARLEDARSFAKYLGGSSCNVAYGAARLGLRSSMLARVGDDHMGRFLREELERVGVDTRSLITDRDRLTGLVILGIEDKETFPLLFYRNDCADMGIRPDDVDEGYIASSRALAITGTHLSHPDTRAAVLTALEYAAKYGLKRILDIDYRPVLWGLTSLADGETRYVDSPEVTADLQDVLGHFDLIVGTEEEVHIAGGSTDTIAALREVRQVAPEATIVCKRGATGCSVFEGAIPDSLDEGITVLGVRVEVLNVLGAGDAFLAGLLRGYLDGETWTRSCEYANACGALVVSRHGCAPAMPSRIELDDYLARRDDVPRPDLDERLRHLHRVTTRKKDERDLEILAFDQDDGDVGTRLLSWPTERVVKCSVVCHSDVDASLRSNQKIRDVYEACMTSGHELLIELQPPDGAALDDEQCVSAVTRIYNLPVRPDWWMLPPLEAQSWDKLEALIEEHDPFCAGILVGDA